MRLPAITACYTVIAPHADRNEKWNVGKADRATMKEGYV